MHLLDEFEAFVELSCEGKTVAEIATRLGCSEYHIRQRLRLGRIAEPIHNAYRQQEIDLETLIAFTLPEDQHRQLQVFQDKNIQISEHSVRRLLTDSKMMSSDTLAKFVGMDAYKGLVARSLKTYSAGMRKIMYWIIRKSSLNLPKTNFTRKPRHFVTKAGNGWSPCCHSKPGNTRKSFPDGSIPKVMTNTLISRSNNPAVSYPLIITENLRSNTVCNARRTFKRRPVKSMVMLRRNTIVPYEIFLPISLVSNALSKDYQAAFDLVLYEMLCKFTYGYTDSIVHISPSLGIHPDAAQEDMIQSLMPDWQHTGIGRPLVAVTTS